MTNLKKRSSKNENDNVLWHSSHIRKCTRKLSLMQQDSFRRMHYEGDISVRVKRIQSHFYQCRSGQHQGISWKGTF
jgi:hypothetical protein